MMDIDAVYLWVDGADPDHASLRRHWISRESPLLEDGTLESRFADHGEIRFSLRSIEQFAPWVRRVYIVTGNQCPHWLDTRHQRLRIVDHREILPHFAALPTFNSTVIELFLDAIPDLSEHFLFLNDDAFLGAPVDPEDFFTRDGRVRVAFTENPCPEGMPAPGDPAWICGLKNANILLDRRFGPAHRRLPLHQVYPLTRHIYRLFRIDFHDACRCAARHRFRSAEDIMFPWHVHPHYAMALGLGMERRFRERWVGLTADAVRNGEELTAITRDRPMLFCLNDQGIGDDPAVLRQLTTFLRTYFPQQSVFELATGTAADRGLEKYQAAAARGSRTGERGL